MENFAQALKRASSIDDVVVELANFYRDQGFSAVLVANMAKVANGEFQTFSTGISEEWRATYRQNHFEKVDPILAHAMRSGEIFQWSDIGRLTVLTSDQSEYLALKDAAGLTDGLALPTFGRRNRLGLTIIGRPKDKALLDQSNRLMLQAAAQQAHIRIDQIESENNPPPLFAPRELDVLRWIARGKSNREIATLLKIKPATVATYLQRIYAKLDVSDRTQAVIEAIRQGALLV